MTAAVIVSAPSGATALPVVRWAGGKRGMARALADIVRRHLATTGGVYVEPFLGGAAVALELGLPGMVLNDACAPLVSTYQALCTRPEVVVANLQALAKMHPAKLDAYNALREAKPTASPYYEAARFLWLNTNNFNGLYRENAKGEYNVPYGYVRRPSYLTLPEAKAFAAALTDAALLCEDFRATISRASPSDFIFADPPYWGGFSDYLAGGFTLADHGDLAAALQAHADAGGAFIETNSDKPDIRALYRWAYIASNKERRAISADAKKRGEANCLIIASSAALLEGLVPT